jgi:hypothetical protein
MATDIVTKMDGGVGMQLLLGGKKKLTIGIDGLELNGANLPNIKTSKHLD